MKNTCYSRSQASAYFSKLEEISMKNRVLKFSSLVWFLLCAKMTQSNCKVVDFL